MAMKSEPVSLESEHPSLEMSEANDMVLNLITRSSTSSSERQQEAMTSADHSSFLSPTVRSGCSFMTSSSDLPKVTASPRESTTSPRGPVQRSGLLVDNYLFSPPPAGGQAPVPPTRFGCEEEVCDVFFLPSQNALPADKRDIEFETYIIARDEEEVNSKCLPKKYKCRFCVYKTSYKSDLNRHLRKHGSSVYHCSLCKMPFRTVGNLENHRRLAHAGVGPAFYDVGAGPIEPPPPPLGNHYDEDEEVIESARRRSHGSNLTQASSQHLLYSLAGTPSSLFTSQLRRPHPSSASSLLLPHSPRLLSATSQSPNDLRHSSPSTLECTPLLSCRLCGFRCTDSTVYGQHQRSHQQSLVSSNTEGSRIREQQKLRENGLRTKTTQPPFFRHRQAGHDHSFTNRSGKDVEGSSLGSAEVKRRRRETPFSISSSDLVSDVQTQAVHCSTNAILPHAPVEDDETGGKVIRDKGIAATTGEAAQMFVVSPIVSPSVFLDDELSGGETCTVRKFKQNSRKNSLRSLKVTHEGKIASNPTHLDSSTGKEGIPRSSNNQPTAFIGNSVGRADAVQSAVKERRPLAPSPYSNRIISFVRHSPHPQTSPSEHATDLTVTKSISSAAKCCALKRVAAAASPKVIVEKWLGHEAKGKGKMLLTDERGENEHNYDTIEDNVEDNTEGGQEEEHHESNRIPLIDSLHLRAHSVDDEERGSERVSEPVGQNCVKKEPESPARSADMDADTIDGADVEVSVETDAASAPKLSLKSCASVVGREDRHMCECATPRSQYEQNSESMAERQGEPLPLYDSSSLACSRSEDESKHVDCRYCGKLMALSDVVDYSRECQWDHKEEPTAYRVCGHGLASTTSLHRRSPSSSSSFAETCINCARQLVGRNILAKHMQKRHSLASSLAARDGQVERIATSPNRHVTGSRKDVATSRPTLERRALSHAARTSDSRWTGSSNVWSYRDVLPGNNQSLSRATIGLTGACAVKPLLRRDKALASPTRFVPTARADRGQGEAVFHPPLTTTTTTVGRFARLESDFDDFAARPYACALCFFRTNQLWELQSHAQNHLTGCNTTPSEETPVFQASPAFRQDRATSPFRSFITRDAGAKDNVCAHGTFKGRQICADSASGSSLRTISSGGFCNSAVVENVNKTWRECTPTFQPRSKRQATKRPLSDSNPDHHDDHQMPKDLLSIPVVSDEKKPCIFNASSRQHPVCTKVRKINTNDLQLRNRRMRVNSKTTGQRFDKRFNKIADPASSGYRSKPRLVRTLKSVAFKRNVHYSGVVSKWEGHNKGHCLPSTDHLVREDGQGDGAQDSHIQLSCPQNMSPGNNVEASVAHPSSSHESSLSEAAAAKGWTASQTSEVGSQSRKRTLKPKVSRAMRTKRTAGVVLGRLKVHACKLCSKAFTLKQLLKRHHRTFHRHCPVTDSSESADN